MARGHVPPLLQIAGHGGGTVSRNSKQKTDQTVLTITKALTKTTNCTFRAKKVEGHDQKETFPALRPHFQIRSGATGCCLASLSRIMFTLMCTVVTLK